MFGRPIGVAYRLLRRVLENAGAMCAVVALSALANTAVLVPRAYAGAITIGVISMIETNANDNYVYITVEGPYDSRPACSTFQRQRFEIDTTLQGGRNSLANSISARALNKQVFAYGTGDCRPSGIDERLQFIGVWPTSP
jgi:hypothetical protein